MKELKPFIVGAGFQMDDGWKNHRLNCAQCHQFDPAKSATAVVLCLEGAVLYKRDNVERPATPRFEHDEHYATKAAVKAAMRYRE